MSEYDPLGSPAAETEDLLRVRELFAGAVALWPGLVDPLLVLALVAFFGSLWMTWSVWRSG